MIAHVNNRSMTIQKYEDTENVMVTCEVSFIHTWHTLKISNIP